jgi:AraC family transcriptional regulator
MSSSRGLEIDFAEPAMAHVARAAFDLNGFSAEYVELSGAEPYDFRSRGENHYLALHDITLTDGELRVDGLPTLHKKDLRDTITFVPKGCGIEGWCQPQPRTNRFVAMYFDPKAIREDLADRYTVFTFPAPSRQRPGKIHTRLFNGGASRELSRSLLRLTCPSTRLPGQSGTRAHHSFEGRFMR